MEGALMGSVYRCRYQVEVFEAALRGNTIAVLDTGSGKTMVAVMLARDHVRRVRAGEAPRRIVLFLAPTVHLVHQVRLHCDPDRELLFYIAGILIGACVSSLLSDLAL
jgi:ERCC4-related helicase